MKTLAALFMGMGIGYMNVGNFLFFIPMGVGIIFMIIDIYYDYKIEINRRKK